MAKGYPSVLLIANNHWHAWRLLAKAIATCAVVPHTAVAQPNILLNPGFESVYDDTVTLAKWLPRFGQQWTLSVGWDHDPLCKYALFDPQFSRTGNVSQKILMYFEYQSGGFWIANRIGTLSVPLDSGGTYRVQGYARRWSGTAYSSLSFAFTDSILPAWFNPYSPKGQTVTAPAYSTKPVSTSVYEPFEFEYIARGGERFLYIGNLVVDRPPVWKKARPYGHVMAEPGGKPPPYCSILIDDLSVVPLYEDERDTRPSLAPSLTPMAVNDSGDNAVVLEITRSDDDNAHGSTRDGYAGMEPHATGLHILFEFNSTRLDEYHQSLLDSFLTTASVGRCVRVIGYTDSVGTDEYNIELSRERAIAVRTYLESTGLPAYRITVEWRGKRREADVPSRLNRRVDVQLKECMQD